MVVLAATFQRRAYTAVLGRFRFHFQRFPDSDRDQGESELKYVFHSISIRNHFANSTQNPPLIRQTALACCFCCAFRVVRVFPVISSWPFGFWKKYPHREPLRREPESSSALLLLCWVKKFNKFYALTFTCIRFFGVSARAPGHSIIVCIPLIKSHLLKKSLGRRINKKPTRH